MASERDPNLYDRGTEPRGQAGYDSWRARVGDAAGGHRLGASVWDLLPGQAAYPYHWHMVEEEVLFILEGTPMVRGPQGWRRLERGAVVAFPAGPQGAHQLFNDSDDVVRFIAVSTSGTPDIVRYPEQELIGVFERPPGEGRLWKVFPEGADTPFHTAFPPPQAPPAS